MPAEVECGWWVDPAIRRLPVDVEGRAEVELAVEVVGHRRNTFGPLHHAAAHPRWVGPGQFFSTGESWQDAYNLVPVGCMSPPRLSVRSAE